MYHARRIDEIISRVAATFAYYRAEDGRWEDSPRLAFELRNAVSEVDSLDRRGTTLRGLFFRALEPELAARYGAPTAQQLVALVRDASRNDAMTTAS